MKRSAVLPNTMPAHARFTGYFLKSVALLAVLILITYAEAKGPPLPEPDSTRGSIGVTFRLKAPMGVGIKKSAVQIFFVRLEGGDEDAFSAEQVIPSTYSKKKQVYLLNAKPGRYVAVAANLGSQATPGSMSPVGGGFSVGIQPPVMKYSAFFSMAMIPQTEVTVVPGEMVFMGDLLAKGSTKMENTDAAQAHYYRMLSPEAADKGYMARALSGSAVYRAELESVSKDVATESSFWSRALKKVFKKEPAWQAFVQRQQQVLAGGTAPEQVVSQSFEQPSIEAVGDDAEIPEAVDAPALGVATQGGTRANRDTQFAGTTAYFPEAQVRAGVPEGWFAYNESVGARGAIYVTKERITGPKSQFRTGMTFSTHYELAMGREFADTASFTEFMFPLLLMSAKGLTREAEFELDTSLGRFRVLEALGRKKKTNSIMWGAAQQTKGLFWFILEAPSEEWEESREQLLELVRAVTLRSSGSPDDEIVVAANHPWSQSYLQRTNRHKDELERRFKALSVGAPAIDYERTMGFQGRRTDRGFTNLTEGWLNRFYTSKTLADFVDVYGIYEGCIAFEMFSVAVTDGEITALKQLDRGAPADFDVDSWEKRIAGMKRRGPSYDEFWDSIRAWRTDPARVAAAVATAQTFSKGMDEQDYLNEAGAFAIQFVPTQLRVVPGVLRIEGPDISDDGARTTYVYGTSKKSVDGRVVVLNGKVESLQFELSDLP